MTEDARGQLAAVATIGQHFVEAAGCRRAPLTERGIGIDESQKDAPAEVWLRAQPGRKHRCRLNGAQADYDDVIVTNRIVGGPVDRLTDDESKRSQILDVRGRP